jgi:hypothetical protein
MIFIVDSETERGSMIKVQINFLSLEESLGVVVEPAVVVGLDVAPS